MRYTIGGKDYSLLKLYLENETVYSEAGAIVLIEDTLKVSTTTYGGLFKGLLRKFLVGESIFLLKIEGSGEVWLAPPLPGEITTVELKDNCYIVQDYAYLAHFGEVKFSFTHKGLKSFLGTELVWLKICGRGILWVSGYGHLKWVEISPSQKLDPLHFVLFEECEHKLESITEGFKDNLFDGEVDFLKFNKPTKVLLQTRIVPPLAEIVSRLTAQKALKNLLIKRRPI